MPFKKGNRAAAVQKGKPKAKTQQWNEIVGWLVGNGGGKYLELLQMQSEGLEINKEQKEYMDRFEALIEYHAPKLARTEQHGEVDHNLIFRWE